MYLQNALSLARGQQAGSFECAPLSLAGLWHDQDRKRQALDVLEPVLGRFTEGFATPDLSKARSLLATLAS